MIGRLKFVRYFFKKRKQIISGHNWPQRALFGPKILLEERVMIMKKYTLTTLAGEKIENCRNYGDAVANAVFDAMVNDDEVCLMEDGFAVPSVLSETELAAVNAELAAVGLEATLQG